MSMDYYVPVPDVVFRPSMQVKKMEEGGALSPKVMSALKSLEPTIQNVRMSLKRVHIIDPRDPGRGDIYFVTVVSDGVSSEPIKIEVKTFKDIAAGEDLQIGPAGLTVYRNEPGKIPRFIDYRIEVMESDSEFRDAGAILDEIRKDDTYKSLSDSLIAISGVTVPPASMITSVVDGVMAIVARALKSNKDDQLIYIAGSVDNAFDDLGTKFGDIRHRTDYASVIYKFEAI